MLRPANAQPCATAQQPPITHVHSHSHTLSDHRSRITDHRCSLPHSHPQIITQLLNFMKNQLPFSSSQTADRFVSRPALQALLPESSKRQFSVMLRMLMVFVLAVGFAGGVMGQTTLISPSGNGGLKMEPHLLPIYGLQ